MCSSLWRQKLVGIRPLSKQWGAVVELVVGRMSLTWYAVVGWLPPTAFPVRGSGWLWVQSAHLSRQKLVGIRPLPRLVGPCCDLRCWLIFTTLWKQQG